MSKIRILIVDDDDDVRESLEDELCNTYEIDSAASGREALARLGESGYDAIISDLRMPDLDGIQVLEAARRRDPEMVRILLTGYLDDNARRATLEPGAPFKISKPWNDEIEVTLKRAFEHREAKRELTSSVVEALAVAGVDDELAESEGLTRLAEILVRRARSLHGVDSCQVTLDLLSEVRVLAGDPVVDDTPPADGWVIDERLSTDQLCRLRVRGRGDTAAQIVRFLAGRALAWASDDPATRLARKASRDPYARNRLSTVSRQAALGTMTASLVQELASVVQTLQSSLYEIEDVVKRECPTPDALDALDAASETSRRMLSLFRAMRGFVRNGDLNHRPCVIADLVERAQTLCYAYLKARAHLRVSDVPAVEISLSEPLILQVLVNLLKNAADASPADGLIDLVVSLTDRAVVFRVIDRGPGVAPEIVDSLFEPFVTSKGEHSGSGLGLAISAQIVADHGGALRYTPAPGGGACFELALPLID